MEGFENLSISDRDELERFRQEWQQDLARKGGPSSPKASFQSLANKPSQVEDPRALAIQLYTEAVEHEQSGKLNEALILYRKAFKLDGMCLMATLTADNVDRLYARQAKPTVAKKPEYTFERTIQTQPDYRSSHPHVDLGTILAQKTDVEFVQEEPIPIASLPIELFEPILAKLNVTSIERFAQTCWKARALTAKSVVWRKMVERIYRGPMVQDWTPQDLVERHAGDWRTTLIEEDRVRLDGCYIAVCHYM